MEATTTATTTPLPSSASSIAACLADLAPENTSTNNNRNSRHRQSSVSASRFQLFSTRSSLHLDKVEPKNAISNNTSAKIVNSIPSSLSASFEGLTLLQNASVDVEMPPITSSFVDTICGMREAVKKRSHDQRVQLAFVKYLIAAGEQALKDPAQLGIIRGAEKLQGMATMFAQVGGSNSALNSQSVAMLSGEESRYSQNTGDGTKTPSSLTNSSPTTSQAPRQPKLKVKDLLRLSDNALTEEEWRQGLARLFFSEGVKVLKKIALTGPGLGKQPLPEAQFMLAEWHNRGIYGVSVDHKRALSLYEQASKQGHVEASFRVAASYELGVGTRRDPTRAVQFYRKAAASGHPTSMHKMAIVLLEGKLGMPKKPKEGLMWLKRAAGCTTEENSEPLFQLALCHLAHPETIKQHNLAEAKKQPGIDEEDEYDEEDEDEDLPEQGFFQGVHRVRRKRGPWEDTSWYSDGQTLLPPGIVIPDDSYALQLFTRAADYGHVKAQFIVAHAHEFAKLGLRRPNMPRALTYYTRAADQGCPDSQVALAALFLSGCPEANLAQSDQDALRWARAAANSNNPKGLYLVGYCYEQGIAKDEKSPENEPLPENEQTLMERRIALARPWYEKSSALNYQRAIDKIKELDARFERKKTKKKRCTIQ